MADADATYAVVDKSKKRKNRTLPGNDTAESAAPDSMASVTALYATVDKSKKKKNSSSKQGTAQTDSTPPLYDAASPPLAENYSMITMGSSHHTADLKKSSPETGAETATTMGSSKKAKTINEFSRAKKITCIAAIVVVVAVAFSALICIAALINEITTLKSKTASLQQLLTSLNSTIAQEQFTSIIQQSSIANNTQQLDMIYERIPKISCAALPPSFPSGYYLVRASNGSAVRVYCDMTRSCGGVTGGWMRVAELDMTNSSHQCPSNLRERTYSSKRTCVITSTNMAAMAACSTTLFNSALEYSKVCGKIIGYQIGGTDGFFRNPLIDQNYVDGVTLTHGNPRQHIWTFAAALNEAYVDFTENCPCTTNQPNNGTPPPEFVGEDYFCDTRSSASVEQGGFYGDDPLWDGAGCGHQSTCCSFNTPPWFYKQLPGPTTDDIEMRVCRDDVATDEDIAIESVEIYVQ